MWSINNREGLGKTSSDRDVEKLPQRRQQWLDRHFSPQLSPPKSSFQFDFFIFIGKYYFLVKPTRAYLSTKKKLTFIEHQLCVRHRFNFLETYISISHFYTYFTGEEADFR